MNFVSVKKDADVKLDGINVSFETRDNRIHSVLFTDKAGITVMITGMYGIEVLTPAPPNMVEKWRLSGKFAGLVDVCEDFENQYAARERLGEFEKQHKGSDDEIGLSIVPVKVLDE